MVRIALHWRDVAPVTRSSTFTPTNPFDPGYRWGAFDQQVQRATARGLEPIVQIIYAPNWASDSGPGAPGTINPNPVEFGNFARAAAVRYSGNFPGLPRVRYWQAWGEPNRDLYLMPQVQDGRIVSGEAYRRLVDTFSANVHAVDTTNRVIAGGLAPLGRKGKPAPLAFMRNMLCLTRSLGRACDLRSDPVEFDIFSHHPYTSGGPTHAAPGRDDVSLGDLAQIKRYVRAAVRLGHVDPQGSLGFWVTEFSWDSNPPDPDAMGASLHARWTAEALYRMWRLGISTVIWWKIQDDPLHISPYQSGFYGVSGKAKHSLRAFRFPTVAFRRGGRIAVWGRTPTSQAGKVTIELKRTGGSWKRLGSLRANQYGIFQRTFRSSARRGFVRARFAGETSLPFSLTNVRDHFVNPFGCGGGITC